MAALRMAALWESRVVAEKPSTSPIQKSNEQHHISKDTDNDSEISDVDVNRVDIDPFDTRPTYTQRKPDFERRPRAVVSADKPPVPPSRVMNQSVTDTGLDFTSPVSSFASSDAGSPRAFQNSLTNPTTAKQALRPSQLQISITSQETSDGIKQQTDKKTEEKASNSILLEIAHLKRVLKEWDERLDTLDIQQKRWKELSK